MQRLPNFISRLTADEREMVDMFAIWCTEVMFLSAATAKLYRSQVGKCLVLELRYDELDVNEKTAWHRFEEFVEWAMTD